MVRNLPKKIRNFITKFLHIIKPKFSMHYVSYTVLIGVIIFSLFNITHAALYSTGTPNPGHPWAELGYGAFDFTNNQTVFRTYTLPDASVNILTDNIAVTVPQGGTGANTLSGILIGNGASAFTGVALTANQSIRMNSAGTAYEAFTPGSGSLSAVSISSANGFAGSSSGGSTPALTISTTVTGILKGNGTSIVTANAGTDFQAVLNGTGLVRMTGTTVAYDNTTYVSSVTTGNGVSAINTAGALAFTLGAINPTSVNGVVFSGSATPTLAVTGTSLISGSNTGDNTANTNYVNDYRLANFIAGTNYQVPLTFSTGLTRLTNTVTNDLSVGVSGGQSVIGGTAVTDILSLKGTTGNGTLTSPAIQALVGSNGGTTAMTILNNGYVGIGTTPNYKVNIFSNVYAPALTYHNGNAGFGIEGNGNGELAIGRDSSSPYEFWFQGRDSNSVAIDLSLEPKGGNVGIGTTSPTALLTVKGVSGDGMVRLVPSSTNGEASIGYYQDTSGTTMTTRWVTGVGSLANTNKFVIGYNNTPVITIDTGGNVGIGTTTPTANLQVAQGTTGVGTVAVTGTAVTGTNTQFTNTFKVGDTITVTTTSGSETKAITTITDNTHLVTAAFTGTASAGTLYTLTGGTLFSVAGNGLLNIGNPGANPAMLTGRLNVANNNRTNGSMGDVLNIFSYGNGSLGEGSNIKMFDANSTSWAGISSVRANEGGGNSDNSALYFTTAYNSITSEKMRITGTGNVGIGTTTPTTKLEVGSTGFGLYSNGGGVRADSVEIGQYRAATPQSIGVYNGNLYLQDGSNGYAGNVGIGTTTPTANLQVAQATTGTGLVTTNGTTALVGSGTNFLNTFKVGDTITVSGETVRTIATITDNTHLTTTVAFSTTASGLTYTLVGGTRFSVFGNGKVGIGTLGPANMLSVLGLAGDTAVVSIATTSGNTCTFSTTTGTFACVSDARLKNTITSITGTDSISKIASLNPVTFHYNWQNHTDPLVSGFIAQEFEKVFPEMVSTDPITGYKSLSYAPLMPYAISAIQEMNLNLEGVSGAIIPLPGSANETFVTAFFTNIKTQIGTWLSDATNGIAGIFAKQVNTENLCVSDSTGAKTCITKTQLDSLLSSVGSVLAPTPIPIPVPATSTSATNQVPVVTPVLETATSTTP